METSVLSGLLIAFCWGSADVSSSLARLSTQKLAVLAQGFGLLFLVCFGIVVAPPLSRTIEIGREELGLLLALGAVSALGYYCMYRAFQCKDVPTGITSAIVSGNCAVTVLLSIGILHEQGQFLPMSIFLSGILLVAYTSSRSRHLGSIARPLAGVLWALAAACCLGCFNFGIGLISQTGEWYWLLFGVRSCSCLFLALLLAMDPGKRSEITYVWRGKDIVFAGGSGVLEMTGIMVFSLTSQHTSIGLMSMIASCSIVIPLCYSIFVKKVQLQSSQALGFVLLFFGLGSVTGNIQPSLVCILGFVFFCSLWFGWIQGRVYLVVRIVSQHLCSVMFVTVLFLIDVLSVKKTFAMSSYISPTKEYILKHVYESHRLDSSVLTSFSMRKALLVESQPKPASDQRPYPGESPAPRNGRKKQQLRLPGGIIAVLLVGSALLIPLFLVPAPHLQSQTSPAMPMTFGTLSFTSSDQFDSTTTSGYNDIVTLSLHDLVSPSQGNAYFAWLMPDPSNDEIAPLFLGQLIPYKGTASLQYAPSSHLNLLATYSGVRITEQPRDPVPIAPSLDPQTWRWEGWFPTIPTPGDVNHYSLLSHLRHLLAKDPTLQANHIPGGLVIWLTRNVSKIEEWSSAAQGSWGGQMSNANAEMIHRHLIRILDYIDGQRYAWQDLPKGSAWLVDPLAGRIGLLNFTQNQEPSGYLEHIDLHLNGLANSPGHTSQQRMLAIQVYGVITKMENDVMQVRQDAIQLVARTSAQLRHQDTLTLLNDMVSRTNEIKSGWFDATSGEDIGGVVWLQARIQQLATIVIQNSDMTPKTTGD